MVTKTAVAEQDKVIVVIQKQAGDIVQRATNFQIVSEESFNESGKIIAWIAMIKKQIKERCEFFVQPLKKQVEEITEKYKVYSKPFNDADKIIRDKMLVYHEREAIQREKEKAKALIEAIKIAKKEKISVEEVMQSVEIKEVAKATDNSTIKKLWTFEITDESKISRQFLMVNETEIKTAIKQGVRTIAGIRIYEKEIISLK